VKGIDMTIEIEKTKKVSNKQLLTDIQNSEHEIKAYEKMVEAYHILAGLPENQESGQSHLLRVKAEAYEALAHQCGSLLEKLLTLKALRGLQ
jgi:hypothetical protein